MPATSLLGGAPPTSPSFPSSIGAAIRSPADDTGADGAAFLARAASPTQGRAASPPPRRPWSPPIECPPIPTVAQVARHIAPTATIGAAVGAIVGLCAMPAAARSWSGRRGAFFRQQTAAIMQTAIGGGVLAAAGHFTLSDLPEITASLIGNTINAAAETLYRLTGWTLDGDDYDDDD